MERFLKVIDEKLENIDDNIENKATFPKDMWVKCEKCKNLLYKKELEENLYVCKKCGFHFRVNADFRINMLIDNGTFREYFSDLVSKDPLNFVDIKPYKEKLESLYKKTNKNSAVITGIGKLCEKNVAIGVLDFSFFAGTMDSVVGEKIYRLGELAIKKNIPLILVSSSGGARMQESILSLMQMAKTSLIISLLKERSIPYISVLADPTTGGVTASFAILGDINIAEPDALIGFAGPRVIEKKKKKKLPDGFQRSEYLLNHGMIDVIVKRKDLKNKISDILDILSLNLNIAKKAQKHNL